MACGPVAVLSHVSAAAHWNLLNYDAPKPEVTAPASRRGVPGIRLHRTHFLDAPDTTRHQGIPTTTVHRTLLDLAANAPTRHLERALAQAERLQLYDHRAIESVIERSNGHRGTKRLTKAIDAGYTVVRFTYRQLRDDPTTVADRLKAIMRRGPARLPRARGGPARA